MSRSARRVDGLVRAVRVLEEVVLNRRGLESALAGERSGLDVWASGAVHDTVSGTLRHLHMYTHLLEASAATVGSTAWTVFETPQLRLLMAASMYQLQQTDSTPAVWHRTLLQGCTHLGCSTATQDAAVSVIELATQPGARKGLSGATSHSLPPWLHSKLEDSMGAKRLAGFGPLLLQRPAQLHLCVSPEFGSPAEYAAALAASTSLPAHAVPFLPHGVTLDSRPRDVGALPGVSTRQVFVQDAAQQWFISQLSPLPPGQTLLDVCAAPGGKSRAALLSLPADGRVVAVEKSRRKSAALREALAHDPRVRVVCGDGAAPDAWWDASLDGEAAGAIVLDAPCSATGILRTRPEAKLHQTAEGVAYLCDLQQTLLRALWPKLRPGGELLYVTCSLLSEENERAVARFLSATPDAEIVKLGDPGRGATVVRSRTGVTFLPSEAHQGGFAAKLRKRAAV